MSTGARAAVDQLADDLADWRRAARVPGAAIALVGLGNEPIAIADGLADVHGAVPLTVAHRFQIGSVSKIVTAITVLRLVEAGNARLDDPVVRHLPWFDSGPSTRQVRIAHLLSHTGGLPMGADLLDASMVDIWLLRAAACLPPGQRFWYSNVGFKALGQMVAERHGRPFPGIVEDDVLRPLGMGEASGSIGLRPSDGDAIGHEARPGHYPARRAPIVPVPSIEVAMGDGDVLASARDMGRFLAGLVAAARGTSSVIGTAMARAMVTPRVRSGAGQWYGYGIGIHRLDGRLVVGHAGDMVGFRSSLIADLEAGVAVVVLANLRGAPTRRLARHAIRVLRAVRRGEAIPVLDEVALDPPDVVGHYGGASGGVEVSARHGGLRLDGPDLGFALLPREDGGFDPDDPVMGRYPVRFQHRRGAATLLTVGGRAFVAGATTTDGPTRRRGTVGRTLVGTYASTDPWCRWVEVVDRDGRLILLDPEGDEQDLVRIGPDTYRVGRGPSPERLIADAHVGGHPLRITLSGRPLYRRTDGAARLP